MTAAPEAAGARSDGETTFEAYERAGRQPGVRNRVLVLPSVICSHMVADRIAAQVPEAVSAPHDHGCAQIGADNEQTKAAFLGIGTNPNIAGTVVVGLGCEVLQSGMVAEELAALDVPVRELSIQGTGGTEPCIEEGVEAARALVRDAETTHRTNAGPGDLTVGIVASDLRSSTTDVAEPVIGDLTDAVIGAGGRVVVAGNERLTPHRDAVVDRAATDAVGTDLHALLEKQANRPAKMTRLRTAAAEHDLEALTRAWDGHPIEAVLEYGERATHDSGLAVLDAPSQFEEAATGLAAAGAQVIIHATADGIPTGHPIAPVLKVSADADTVAALPDDIDVDATATDGDDLFRRVLAVANGEESCAERHGLSEFAITRVGPSM